MVSRTSKFRSLAFALHKYLQNRKTEAAFRRNIPSSPNLNYSNFESLNVTQKTEVLAAVKSLKDYKESSLVMNERRKKLFRLLSSKQQKLATEVGYMSRLNAIDKAIAVNYKLVNDIADYTINKYGISSKDLASLDKKSAASGSNFRVIEALGHYSRDWQQGNVGWELLPIFEYIASQLQLLFPTSAEKKETALIFPGSGLGRLTYEFSKDDYGAVFAIENSGLMNSLVDFHYRESQQNEEELYTVHPYIHINSDFYSTKSQFRSFKYKPIGSNNKPESLITMNQDFLEFEIPNRDKYKNIVVVSVFFLDTAENLFAYLEKIRQLTKPSGRNGSFPERGYWINAGPLKYGSAAQVELNADELAEVNKKMGWINASSVYSVYDPLQLGNKTGLVGYLTDKESMWQGYYGLNLFTSSRKENKNV
ncbi:hypothetical protein KGF56_004537 [Candida oxycetoniae]|uniref:Carnosine N-methyltransferase n=1 Tax=Candida oxycetoniae TaxID=497107 RepID=A0AAI9STA1_9ASCO|nr:uncharacterized protein KGF56_004537 [Candida oxycetoniae]KAI3402656.2 hypothetical protein KGF56_004537 [Candida oxycetoniae]